MIFLEYIIPSKQLEWTKHANIRLVERGLAKPPKYSRWQAIGRTYNVERRNFTWTLRFKNMVIVTERLSTGQFVVITTYKYDEFLREVA